jgi:hypothetical protein
MSVESYPSTAVERAMKVEEVLLRAGAGKFMWWQAAEIIGISDRQLRRWRKRYEVSGYDGLLDRWRGVPSSERVTKAPASGPIGIGFNQMWRGSLSPVVEIHNATPTPMGRPPKPAKID